MATKRGGEEKEKKKKKRREDGGILLTREAGKGLSISDRQLGIVGRGSNREAADVRVFISLNVAHF